MIKLLTSNFDKEDGVSYVKIATDCGNFEGFAFLHPEDKEIVSTYLGCEIAEYRATIEYFKHKKYIVNIEIQELFRIRKELIKNNSFFGLANKRAIRNINIIIEKKLGNKEFYATCIKTLNRVINNKVNDRIDYLNKKKDSE